MKRQFIATIRFSKDASVMCVVEASDVKDASTKVLKDAVQRFDTREFLVSGWMEVVTPIYYFRENINTISNY